MVGVFAPLLRSGQLHRPVTDAPNGEVAADRHGFVDQRDSGHYAATSSKFLLSLRKGHFRSSADLCSAMAQIMPAGDRPVVPHRTTPSRTACGVGAIGQARVDKPDLKPVRTVRIGGR